MAYDLDAAAALAWTVLDDAGQPTNAAAVDLTITLPDGTAVPLAPAPPAQTGVYGYSYPCAQQGRHLVRWASTGPARAYTDVLYVRSVNPYALVSLADVKAHLNIDAGDTTHDDELRDAIECATDVIEGIVGAIARRSITETHSGHGRSGLALRCPQVLEVTNVTESGVAVDPAGYSLSDAGVLYRVAGYTDLTWPAGRNNIAVTYAVGTAGRIAASILDSAKELVRINFRPQLGGNYSPFDGGNSDDYGTPTSGEYRFGFFVPNRIMGLLEPHSTALGFA